MVQRDAELLRRVATIQRFFGRGLELLTAPGFEPFPREVNGSSAYAIRFSRGDMLLYTLVNLASGDDVATINVSAGWTFRDCYHGGELLPSRGVVKAKVEGRGIGCVFAQPLGASLPRGYNRFENVTASLAQTPLSSFSSNWSPLQAGAPSRLPCTTFVEPLPPPHPRPMPAPSPSPFFDPTALARQLARSKS